MKGRKRESEVKEGKKSHYFPPYPISLFLSILPSLFNVYQSLRVRVMYSFWRQFARGTEVNDRDGEKM